MSDLQLHLGLESLNRLPSLTLRTSSIKNHYQFRKLNCTILFLYMKFLIALLQFLSVISQTCPDNLRATILNLAGKSPAGDSLGALSCDPNTQIDFGFTQAAAGDVPVVRGPGNLLTLDILGNQRLQFLNRDMQNLTYVLRNMALAPYSLGKSRVVLQNIKTPPSHELSITFTSTDDSQDTVVSIYLIDDSRDTTLQDSSVIADGHLLNPQLRAFYELVQDVASVGNSGKIRNIAGGLSYLNLADLSAFYTVQTTPQGCGRKQNFLLSAFTIKLPTGIDLSAVTASTTYTYTNNQTMTGGKLCYGSHGTGGVFRAQVRGNFPLWTAWFSMLLFWTFILFSTDDHLNMYSEEYENNKMTSCQLYSLWYLGHEVIFPKMMRTTGYLVSFGVICLVPACSYAKYGDEFTSSMTIVYFGMAGMQLAYVFSYATGFLMYRYYQWTRQTLITRRKINLEQTKEEAQVDELQDYLAKCQDRIFVYSYCFYTLSIVFIVACWALSVNQMQKPSPHNNFLMYYWLVSVGLGFSVYSLVLTPILGKLAGNFLIFRIRGYWYDADLGRLYREVQM